MVGRAGGKAQVRDTGDDSKEGAYNSHTHTHSGAARTAAHWNVVRAEHLSDKRINDALRRIKAKQSCLNKQHVGRLQQPVCVCVCSINHLSPPGNR